MAYGKSKLAGHQPGVVTLEIKTPSDSVAKLLRDTSVALKQVANRCVWTWLTYHDRHQSLLKMRYGVAVHPCPPELTARWLREALAIAPHVHCATVLAVTNWLAQTFTRQDSPRVNDKRWRAVLRCDETAWCFVNPLPIRLWNGNAKIVRTGGDVAIVVRLDRIVTPGERRATSTETVLVFRKPKGSKRAEGHREAYGIAAEIADLIRPLSQCQLVEEKTKWLLRLTVGMPGHAHAKRTGGLVIVRPGRLSGLWLRGDVVREEFGDTELDEISSERLAIDRIRRSCRETSAQVPQVVSKRLERRWNDKASHICHRLVDAVAAWMAKKNYSRVLWLDGNNRTCALALAGRQSDRDPRELFPFARMRKIAERKLSRIGIEVVGRANFRSVKRRRQRAMALKASRNGHRSVNRSHNGSATVTGKGVAKTV